MDSEVDDGKLAIDKMEAIVYSLGAACTSTSISIDLEVHAQAQAYRLTWRCMHKHKDMY